MSANSLGCDRGPGSSKDSCTCQLECKDSFPVSLGNLGGLLGTGRRASGIAYIELRRRDCKS